MARFLHPLADSACPPATRGASAPAPATFEHFGRELNRLRTLRSGNPGKHFPVVSLRSRLGYYAPSPRQRRPGLPLYKFLRHWLASRLRRERYGLFLRRSKDYCLGLPPVSSRR